MSCNCETYQCLDVLSNDCEDIVIDLEATETGEWVLQYEFNGTWKKATIEVENGENITLPAVFNESYIHVLKLFKSNGDLFNDTCYKLNTAQMPGFSSSGSASSDTPNYYTYIVVSGTPSDELDANGRKEINAGVTIEDSRLVGRTAIGVSALSQSYNDGDFSKAKASDTLTMTNGASFGLDTVIRIDLKPI